jgi:DNA repair exonuclease SbcCD nuclease subunit
MRVYHIADLHLGKAFSPYPELASELAAARLDTLADLVARANDEAAELFVIAGDLFDRPNVRGELIVQAAEILNRFSGSLVLVLPGNHDYIGPESKLWRSFRDSAGDRVMILDEARRYELDAFGLAVDVFAAPCDKLHSHANRVGWIAPPADSSRFALGVAHGSVRGLSPDFENQYFPMSTDELAGKGLDLWLLGHTHVSFPESAGPRDRVFNPGTPEPDGFDCPHFGRAFVYSVDLDTKSVQPELLRETGRYRFVHHAVSLSGGNDPGAIAGALSSLSEFERPEQTLLKLKLTGRIAEEERAALSEAINEIRPRFAYFEEDRSELRLLVDRERVDKEYPSGSLPHRLLSSLLAEEDEAALELAFDLLGETRREN